MKQISQLEGIDCATVRNVFKAAENVIYDKLSSVTPSEDIVIKILKGLCITRSYVPATKYSKGAFENIECGERVKTKAKITKHFNQKVNKELFDENTIGL